MNLKLHRPDKTRAKARGRKDSPARAGQNPALVSIVAIGAVVYANDAVTRPLVGQLVSEDTCWQVAHAQWLATRPHWWDFKAMGAWREDGARIEAKRARIREFATELGISGARRPR